VYIETIPNKKSVSNCSLIVKRSGTPLSVSSTDRHRLYCVFRIGKYMISGQPCIELMSA